MSSIDRHMVAAIPLLSVLAAMEVVAMDPGYLVVSIDGPAPQSVPVPHLPQGFMREGQVLTHGDEYLLLAGTRLVLVNDERREIVTVRGPNRLSLRAGTLEAYDPTGLNRLEAAYFSDPRVAVETTAQLLRDESWVELALHYDLSGTDTPLSSLLLGSFFVRDTLPEVGHPGGFSRFRQPFAPSFSYESHRTLEGGDIEVRVHVTIDQGGGMVQEGWDTFTLRASRKGLQHLPKVSPEG